MKNKKIILWKCMLIIPIFTLFLSNVSYAQQNTATKLQEASLTGKVTDEVGRPLAEVLVHVVGAQVSSITKEDGTFSLANITDSQLIIEFTYNGYTSKYLPRGNESVINLKMQKDISFKERQVNLVYDIRPEYSITSSVSTISGDELNKTPHMNLRQALAGRLPGLIMKQASTAPGSENFTPYVRGTSTLNGKSPLILIDGIVSDNLSIINPRDVESVSVYKDAAATVLYGMQGGNGIISVTTKHGSFGKPRIEVFADYSIQKAIKTPTMLTSGQHATLMNEASRNAGGADIYSQDDIDKYNSGVDSLYPNNNWYNEFVKPLLHTQRIGASASGGNNTMKYYANVAYTHQGGPFNVEQNLFNPEQSVNRYNFRSNLDVKMNTYVGAFANLSGHVQRANGAINDVATIYSSVFDLPPTMYGPLTPEDQVTTISTITNPTYGRINRDGYKQQTYASLSAILGLNVDLSFALKGLSSTLAASFDTKSQSNIIGNGDYERWMHNVNRTDSLEFIKTGTQVDQPVTLTKSAAYSYRTDYKWILNYKNQIGKHVFNTFAFSRLIYENAADVSVSGIQPYVYLTYGGNISYSYDNIIFADLSASYDGSEQFAPGHQFGLFPAASMAWVATNQDFLKDNITLSNLKVRLSYGQVGNDQFSSSRFSYLDNIRSASGGFISSYGGRTINEVIKGNPYLTWETSTIANVGVEVGLWNQLSIILDLFHDRRTDILVNSNTVPILFGVQAENLAPLNQGEVVNQGFEFSLGYGKDINKDLYVGIQSNFCYNKNNVISASELVYDDTYKYKTRVAGYSIGQQWGYLVDMSNGNGYFNSQEEIVNSGLTYEGVIPRPGDLKFTDLNGDNIIDNADMAPIGKSSIPQISWGANLIVKWKNFDANIFFQGLGQYSSTFSGIGIYESYNSGTFFKKHLNAWTAERYANGEKITAPALSTTTSASHTASDFYNYDLSFGRLKSAEIGYQLPFHITKKFNCQSMRVYISGLNLLTFDKLGDEDFDVENSGVDSYPLARYFNVGLNLVF